MEFVRYHKRTTRNFQMELQAIIDSSKQTVAKGINQKYVIAINQVRLNKACTVANIFWSLSVMAPELISPAWRKV